MTVIYRQFKASDRKIITEFIKSLYQESPEGKPASDKKINKTFDELANYRDKGTILVIAADHQVIRYSILINFWSNEYGGNIINIDEIYIKEDFRGRGIGTKFIQYLINNKLNNSVALELEVMPSNKRARQLYERIGFKLSQNNHFVYDSSAQIKNHFF
jgi:GNAT superfamily N-acetyltransferase